MLRCCAAREMAEEEGEIDSLIGEKLKSGADEVGVSVFVDSEFSAEAGVIVV